MWKLWCPVKSFVNLVTFKDFIKKIAAKNIMHILKGRVALIDLVEVGRQHFCAMLHALEVSRKQNVV